MAANTAQPTRRWLIATPLIIMVAAIGVLSFRWGLASLETLEASRTSARLLRSVRPNEQARAQVQRAMDHLDRAHDLRGRHPEQSDLRGQLLHWEAVRFASAGRERGEALATAAGHYRDAIAQRPAWPYYWANLAVAKSEWGIFDEEFARAVERATATGPWEPRVQLQLIRMDFVEGDRLDEQTRQRIDGLLHNAVRIQPARVMALADHPSQVARICALLEDRLFERQCRPYRDSEAAGG